jgi:alkylhydroperoxidase family enzyme
MANIAQERKALVARILEGPGEAPRELRRAAFDDAGLAQPLRTLVDKVARHAFRVTDQDITAARASGLSEDQIFELAVCAAVGQATRQYDAALAALETATKGEGHAPRDPR